MTQKIILSYNSLILLFQTRTLPNQKVSSAQVKVSYFDLKVHFWSENRSPRTLGMAHDTLFYSLSVQFSLRKSFNHRSSRGIIFTTLPPKDFVTLPSSLSTWRTENMNLQLLNFLLCGVTTCIRWNMDSRNKLGCRTCWVLCLL